MPGGDRFEGRPDPGVGVEAVQFRRLDQRNDPASCGCTLIVTRKQGVFPVQGNSNRADQILDIVAVQLDPPFGKEQLKAVPVAGDPPVRAMDRVRAAGERLRRMARRTARARLAPLASRRRADLYRQPVGRAAGLPARRARRDGQQLRGEPHPPGKAHGEKRAVRRPRRGRARMGPHRQPDRDLQDERRRALRLAQEHAGENHRRPPQQPHRRTPALELQATVKLRAG